MLRIKPASKGDLIPLATNTEGNTQVHPYAYVRTKHKIIGVYVKEVYAEAQAHSYIVVCARWRPTYFVTNKQLAHITSYGRSHRLETYH